MGVIGGSDGGLDGFVQQTFGRAGLDGLPAHLEERYGISVRATEKLDVGVVRVDRLDGPSWVARVFPAARPLAAVEGDARILQGLERQGFPAERCATADPVSVHEGQGVLVTELVEGDPADGRGRSFGYLGGLLGALHARTRDAGTAMRPGGAWHHLGVEGGPREEVAAALSLLDAARERVPTADAPLYAGLQDQLRRADACDGLPEGLIHPDYVPVNAIRTPEDKLVMVDWTGAGRGPRLWSLAFLLWAGGARDLRLVDVAVAHYGRHLRPEPEELARLAAVIPVRPLILDCWAFCVGRLDLAEVMENIPFAARHAEAIADRACQAFAALS
jgi:aminoglycoside phosphotransferase (APT) family kinase protein